MCEEMKGVLPDHTTYKFHNSPDARIKMNRPADISRSTYPIKVSQLCPKVSK
jgi:hypothetical protein